MRVYLPAYESKPTDKREQYDWMVEKKLDGQRVGMVWRGGYTSGEGRKKEKVLSKEYKNPREWTQTLAIAFAVSIPLNT